MGDINTGVALAYIIGLILILIIGRIFASPLKFLIKVLVNGLLGGVAIIIINFVGKLFGFHLPVNIVTALIAGMLGIPGVVLLIALKILFGI